MVSASIQRTMASASRVLGAMESRIRALCSILAEFAAEGTRHAAGATETRTQAFLSTPVAYVAATTPRATVVMGCLSQA